MRRKTSLIRWAAVGLLMMAAFFAILQLTRYAQVRAAYPTGLKVAGIPVGGLNFSTASERLVQVFMAPIEITYGSAAIQVRPATLGFELLMDNMLAAADQQRTGEPFWSGFWKFLWNRPMSTQDIPLQADFDEARITNFLLNEIAVRYNEPSTPPMPIPGEAGFYPGQTGTAIDYDVSLDRVKAALSSPNRRTANLEIETIRAARPTFDLLEYMLKDIIQNSAFDGLVEFYLKDLQTGLVVHFTESRVGDEEIPLDVAYSSWSTIKIPVLMSAFKYLQEPYDPLVLAEIEEMVELSDNESTDSIAKKVIEQNLAPIRISEDMQTLGLKNTFWAGYFGLGSPLLQAYVTPANERTDIDTDPDRYAQTTPLDLGLLLEEIYYCAEDYGGSIPLAFDGEITQGECQLMVEYLRKNDIGVFLQAGVPASIPVAHKHGWAVEVKDGLMHTMADAGILYTPGGDYVISVFLYHPVQAIFDVANLLVANLSGAVYNYFNLQ